MTATKSGTPFLFWSIMLAMIAGAGCAAIGQELLALVKK
jgi:hypothetical protein